MKDETISFDQILKTIKLSVRRTAVFLGLGLNVALDENYDKYGLTDITAIEIIPPDQPPERVQEFRDEFAIWLIANGFRDLIEALSEFLNQIFMASMRMAISKGHFSIKQGTGLDKKFRDEYGVRGKVRQLNNLFNITPKHPERLTAFHSARNSLVHAKGRVRKRDCKSNDTLKIEWDAIDSIISTPDGQEELLEVPIKTPLYIEKGGIIAVKKVVRKTEFGIGELIQLSPRDLAEICQYLLIATDEIIKSTAEYAKSIGIKEHGEGN